MFKSLQVQNLPDECKFAKILNGRIYTSTVARYCCHDFDGNLIWEFSAEDPHRKPYMSAFTITSPYFVALDGQALQVRDVSSGLLLHKLPFPDEEIYPESALDCNGRLYLQGWAEDRVWLSCLDLQSMQWRWRIPTMGHGRLMSILEGILLFSGGRKKMQTLYAASYETGEVLWQKDTSTWTTDEPPFGMVGESTQHVLHVGETIILPVREKHVACLHLQSGAVRWVTAINGRFGAKLPMLLNPAGNVVIPAYVHTHLNPKTGTIVHEFPLRNGLIKHQLMTAWPELAEHPYVFCHSHSSNSPKIFRINTVTDSFEDIVHLPNKLASHLDKNGRHLWAITQDGLLRIWEVQESQT
jgi:outer membrane protein assembly factor BamB